MPLTGVYKSELNIVAGDNRGEYQSSTNKIFGLAFMDYYYPWIIITLVKTLATIQEIYLLKRQKSRLQNLCLQNLIMNCLI